MPSALLDRGPVVFERGDKIYLTTRVQRSTLTDAQVDELAFATQVKKQAPNENLIWLSGQYVEAERPNLNGAMWTMGDLAIASLTPNLMPVTVMHDPRTAVGTIADSKLLTPAIDHVVRARIDTVLALWAHRFHDVAEEALHNIDQGSLMQSMECFTPWYECSVCGMAFAKLPNGAERANWCSHLNESQAQGTLHYAGHESTERQSGAARILKDVCFTGTGLIFGSRGAVGAYTEAHLSEFQEEVAEWHQRVHTDTSYTATATRRNSGMALVQIDEQELATLRRERDEARADAAKVPALEADLAEARRQAESEETARKRAEEERDEARAKVDGLEEAARATRLADDRMSKLGDGFKAKLGEIAKANLTADAKKLKDEEWDNRLKEIEETAGVKRDARGDGSDAGGEGGGGEGEQTFSGEELAQALTRTSGGGEPASRPTQSVRSTVGQLSDIFSKTRRAA